MSGSSSSPTNKVQKIWLVSWVELMLRIISRGVAVMQSFMWSYFVIGYWPCWCRRSCWSPLPAGFVPTTFGWIAKCFSEDFGCQAPHYEKGWSMSEIFGLRSRKCFIVLGACLRLQVGDIWSHFVIIFFQFFPKVRLQHCYILDHMWRLDQFSQGVDFTNRGRIGA